MRGVPDFSALASQVLIYNHGNPSSLSGTSAASPILAALFARVGYSLYTKQSQLLGDSVSMSLANATYSPFVNLSSFLYSATATTSGGRTNCWVDVTLGDNCATMGAEGATLFNFQTLYDPNSYRACYGNMRYWDAVNGVGVPSFAALLSRAEKFITDRVPNPNNNNNNNNNGAGGNGDGSGNEGIIVVVVCVVGVIVIGIAAFAAYRSGKFGCGGDDASAANTQFQADASYRNAAAEMHGGGGGTEYQKL